MVPLASFAADEPPAPLPVADLERDAPVDFATELFPALRRSCLPCHNADRKKGKLSMETVAAMMEGAGGDPVLVPRKPDESLLWITSAHLDEPPMPPPDNKADAPNLSPTELALLKRWIAEGCEGEAPSATDEPLAWTAIHSNVAPIIAIGVSPDNQFAACGRGPDVVIYNLVTERAEQRLAGAHRDLVQSVAFNRRGLLATGGFRTLKLWERDPRQGLANWELNAPVTALASTSNGTWFAAGDEAGHIAVWSDSETRKPAARKIHGGAVTGLAFAPDGRLLTVSADKSLRVLDAALAEQRRIDLPHPATALALAGEHAITAGGDNKLRGWTWDTTNAVTNAAFELDAHPAPVIHLALHGDRLYAADPQKALRWNLAERKPDQNFVHGVPPFAALAAGPDKRLLTVGATLARVWNTDNAQKAADIKGRIADRVAEAAWGREQRIADRLLALRKKQREDARKKRDEEARKLSESAVALAKAEAESRGKEAVFRAAERVQLEAEAHAAAAATNAPNRAALDAAVKKAKDNAKKPREDFEAARQAVKAARLNRDSALRLSQRSAETALLAEARFLELEETRKLLDTRKAELDTRKAQPVAPATAGTIAGPRVLIAAEDGALQSFAARDGRDLETLLPLPTKARTLHALADGRVLAGLEDKRVHLLDPRPRWRETRSITGLVDRVAAVAFSPDGRLLALGCGVPTRGGVIQVRDVETDTLLWANDAAHEDAISGLAFSPDGRTLASCSPDKFVRTWDAASGEAVRAFEGHTGYVLDLAWSADGQLIASAGADKVVKIWLFEEGRQKQIVDGFGHEVTAVAFLGEQEQFVCASGDKTVRIGKDGRLPEVKDFMHACAVSPDGQHILAGGQDRVLRLWSAQDKKLRRAFE